MKNKIYYLSIILTALFCFESCTNKKPIAKVEKTTTLKIPCTQFRTDKNFFRASASFKGPDLQLTRETAAQLARTTLAANIKANIEATNNRYVEQRNIGDKVEFTQKVNGQSSQIIVDAVQFTSIVCEEPQQHDDGQVTVYCAIEVSQDIVLNGIEKAMSADEKLRQDFDAAEYRKIHEAKIQEYKENK